jgi:hypothetical protein
MKELREEFEAFHSRRKNKGATYREGLFTRCDDGSYVDYSVQRHWWTWQNAIKSSHAHVGEAAKVDANASWIDCSERMPEPDSGEVLVWLTGGRCAFDEWHMNREDPTGMGGPTMEMGLMWRDYDYDEITHWMPLPAAPAASPTPETP